MTENKPSTAAETRRIFKRHWLPVFARRLLQDIGTREITAIIDRHRQQAPHEARHAFVVLRKFFNWAKQQRLTDRSPCDNLKFGFRVTPRTRVLSDRELAVVFNAAGDLGYPYGPIVQVLPQPLDGVAARLQRFTLGQALVVGALALDLDGENDAFEVRVGFGAQGRRLSPDARFSDV